VNNIRSYISTLRSMPQGNYLIEILTGVTADLVAYLGDSAGEVGDALGGNIGHAGGMR
jgi:hypothetical protein